MQAIESKAPPSPSEPTMRQDGRLGFARDSPLDILLFSMPDSFEHMPTVAVRMPNGALTSLAGKMPRTSSKPLSNPGAGWWHSIRSPRSDSAL
jgi:hypothetical protein